MGMHSGKESLDTRTRLAPEGFVRGPRPNGPLKNPGASRLTRIKVRGSGELR